MQFCDSVYADKAMLVSSNTSCSILECREVAIKGINTTLPLDRDGHNQDHTDPIKLMVWTVVCMEHYRSLIGMK